MKKIISFLVIALLSMTTINVNAAGSSATKENLTINGKEIASGKQIFVYGCSTGSTIYYDIRNYSDIGDFVVKYYKYNTGNITEIKEGDLKLDCSNQDNLTASKYYKLEKDEANMKTNVYVDGKLDGSYNTDFDTFLDISNNAFYYSYNLNNGEKNYKVFVFEGKKVETIPIQETPKTTPVNIKLDKALKPFFEKTDKKGDEIAQKTYKTLISKIDILLKKRLSVKNKNTLNYLKEKVQEKIK